MAFKDSRDERELKIALVGCGGRGTGAAVQALSTKGKVTLWAMADAFADQLERSHKSLLKSRQSANVDVPPERRFTGLDAYRKVMALDEIDVVILATPPGFRPLQFAAAVAAGKHVFMEKPVATDAPGVRRVLTAAEEAKRKGLKVGVGLQRRHSALYQETRERIRQGAIGEPVFLRAYFNTGGTSKLALRKPEWSELEYQVRNWYYFTWLSGDHLVEQHIHNLDIACWIKGAYPVRAQGQGGREVRTGKEYGQIFDHHAVEYEFADGSRLLGQCRHIGGCENHVGEHVDGETGTASVVSKRIATIRRYGQEEPLWRGRNSDNAYQIEHDLLFAAIRDDRPHNEAEYGARSTMTAILGRMASYSGKMIEWNDAFRSNLELTTDAQSWTAPAPVEPDDDGFYPVAVPGQTKVL